VNTLEEQVNAEAIGKSPESIGWPRQAQARKGW
jgi:hypothetical protein